MNTELLDFRAMMQDLASTQVAPYARDVDEQIGRAHV